MIDSHVGHVPPSLSGRVLTGEWKSAECDSLVSDSRVFIIIWIRYAVGVAVGRCRDARSETLVFGHNGPCSSEIRESKLKRSGSPNETMEMYIL